MTELGKPGVAAVKWSVISTAARFGLQLFAQIILARTLGPEIFGLFAIGMVLLTFAGFISGFGFSWSLLQRDTLTDEDVRFAWTWQLLVGAVASLLLYLSAPWFAAYFREARAQQVIEWLSIACVLTAAASPATYLLQRDLNFRAIGVVQVASYALGYILVGVPMAYSGYGVKALVAAWLVQCVGQFVLSYAYKPHPIRPLFWYEGARLAASTGRSVFFTNVVNWTLNNIDRILIGRMLNAQFLGLYNLAYNLATMPNVLLLGSLQPAFLAAGARLQNDRQRLGRVYVQMLSSVLVLTIPAFVFLAAISPDIVRLLYGAKWEAAGRVLGILFLGIPAYVVWGLSTPVLWNTGRKNYEYGLQLPLIAVGAAAFYIAAPYGIQAAAGVASGLLLMRAMVISFAALKALGLGLNSVGHQLLRGLVLAAICAATALGGAHLAATLHSPLLSLISSTGLTFAVAASILVARPYVLGQEASEMLVRFIPALSPFVLRNRAPGPHALAGEQQL
jgi:lipopolysaccharide exporter